jgi:hypothetical protein
MVVASRDAASSDLPFQTTADAPVIIMADAGLSPDVVVPRDSALSDIAASQDMARVGDTMIVTSTPDAISADVFVRQPAIDSGAPDIATFVDGATVPDAAKPIVAPRRAARILAAVAAPSAGTMQKPRGASR